MEKIMNLQMPGNLPAGVQARAAQNADSGDGFLKLLQQKQEISEAKPEQKEPVKPVKDEQAAGKEEPKKEPAEEEEPEESMAAQLVLELAAQQTVVQDLEVIPDYQDQPVQPIQAELPAEAAAAAGELPAEAVSAAGEFPVEAAAVAGGLPKEVKAEDIKAQVSEKTGDLPVPKKAEGSAEDLTPQPVAPERKPEEGVQKTAVRDEGLSDTGTDEAPKSAVPVRETAAPVTEKVSGESGGSTEAVYGMAEQRPAVQQTADTPGSVDGSGEPVVKTTVEELPRELGKALTSGRMTGTQTLTVELEPASLGKLTIRLEYEAGRTAVSIMSSNPKTLELLNQKASEIAAILKEHTGEETMIYTQEPQRQEADQQEGHQGSSRGGQEEQKQQKEEERRQTESFAQQLRLGLV